MARPFLKWAGGKSQLVPELLKHVPKKYGTYYEPFVGGGALFFALEPKKAVIGDMNQRLVNTYEALADSPEKVFAFLRMHAANHNDEYYYETRDIAIDESHPIIQAAWLIYLNKTCFNGLYRVNRSGKFNVPIGSYKNPSIYDPENLRACSAALHPTGAKQGVTIRCGDYRMTCAGAQRGDLVYFDPPYLPVNKTSDFTAYTPGGFGLAEHEALRDFAWGLKCKGVHVILSNAGIDPIAKLYSVKNFRIHEVQARRAINSKAGKRGPVSEFIIT